MGSINRFATRHPVWFVLASMVTWSMLLIVFMGLASGALRRPYGDDASGAIARLAIGVCVVTLVWRLGWLRTSGIGGLGGRPVWLLAIGGLGYSAGACLYSFYGRVAIDPSILIGLPSARTTVLAILIAALGGAGQFRCWTPHGAA
jgi:hypothetical protein